MLHSRHILLDENGGRSVSIPLCFFAGVGTGGSAFSINDVFGEILLRCFSLSSSRRQHVLLLRPDSGHQWRTAWRRASVLRFLMDGLTLLRQLKITEVSVWKTRRMNCQDLWSPRIVAGSEKAISEFQQLLSDIQTRDGWDDDEKVEAMTDSYCRRPRGDQHPGDEELGSWRTGFARPTAPSRTGSAIGHPVTQLLQPAPGSR